MWWAVGMDESQHIGLSCRPEMANSELKTASLRIHLQYSVHNRDALGKQKLGRTFNLDKQDVVRQNPT